MPAELERSLSSENMLEPESSRTYAMGGMAIFLIGTALAAAGGILLEQKIVVFAGILTMLIGMFLIAYSSMIPRRHKRSVDTSVGTAEPEMFFRAETTKQLVQPREQPDLPSVTEATTDLLKVPVAKKNDILNP